MKVTGGPSSWTLGTLEGTWIPLLGVGLLLGLRGFGLVIARIFVLPLDFHGRPRFIRSMFIRGALHGIEAFFFS